MTAVIPRDHGRVVTHFGKQYVWTADHLTGRLCLVSLAPGSILPEGFGDRTDDVLARFVDSYRANR